MSKKIKLSIIIVHYRVKKELFINIQSILSSIPKMPYEIIVVDNDEEKKIYQDLHKKFPKVIYIANENKGYGQGNNTGAKVASGEYLFILNPDTKMYPGCINLLVSYLDSHKDTGIAAPFLYENNDTAVSLQGAKVLTPFFALFTFSLITKLFPNNFIAKKYWLFDRWDGKSIKKVESVPGAGFMIRREIFQQIGGFDEKFFLFFEEQDLCKRVGELSWKIVMIPQAKLMHSLGNSMKKSKKNIRAIFSTSRFYYFKKHFGFFSAIFTEAMLRFGKQQLFLTVIASVGFFLRVDKLDETMVFIGDQGWFYLSARDMLLTGNIPLVGIESSHPWLHQGALWTYMLAGWLWLFKFDPLSPGYLTALFDVVTILLLYKVGSVIFSKRIGIITAALYATSPLIVLSSRMPYHTSPIPLVATLSLLFIYQWVKGNKYYFPLVILSLTTLYNLELSTVLMSAIVFMLLLYGIVKKKKWAVQILNKKILVLSIGLYLFSMLPMLLYDMHHHFPQTFGFLAWLLYRILVLLGLVSLHVKESTSLAQIVEYSKEQYIRFLSPTQSVFALTIFIFGIVFFVKRVLKERSLGIILLTVVNTMLLAGFFINKTSSNAYLPILFPGMVFFIAIVFDTLLRHKIVKWVGIGALLFLLLFNCYYLVTRHYLLYKESETLTFAKRLSVAKYIVKEADGKEYNLRGEGPGSQFVSFTMSYEYLTWWLGYGPSSKLQRTKFIINENNYKITITKRS